MATDRIEAEYRVVTPLFCGGARPSAAELRLPSFKGVLRWWWRALAWARCGGDLFRVQAAEDELFGSARGGQSKLVMRLLSSTQSAALSPPALLRQGAGANANVVGEGARYLGYGVMEAFGSSKKGVQAGQLIRACFEAPFNLKLELRARDVDEPTRALLFDALKAVGVLGGIGAKSRKGYGSLVLTSMSINGASCWRPPASVSDLLSAVEGFFPAFGGSTAYSRALPPYTALSSRTRVVLVPAAGGQSHPLALLDRVGREMMRFRSWGHNGKVLGSDSEKNFRDDHDLMKKPAAQRNAHPRRIIFGLPHNYGKNKEQQVGPAGDRVDRRASPLVIHVHECGTTPVAVLSLLPAQFLPGGDAAQVNVGGKNVGLTTEHELWKPVGDLLDRFLSDKRKEPFGQALEARP